MEIYIEVIVVDNFIIDYIILHICGMKERVISVWWRRCLASVLGVVVVFLSLLDTPSLVDMGVKVIGSLGMVFIAFGRDRFFKLLFDFYFFTFAIGGCAMGVLYLKEGIEFGVFGNLANLPTGLLVGCVFAGYIIAKKVIYIWSGRGARDCYCYAVEIIHNGGCKRLNGFLDTGNLLTYKDDLRGVCICEYSTLAWFLKGEKPSGEVATHTAVGCDFLSVYIVEEIKIYKNNVDGVEELVLRWCNVPVALSKVSISNEFDMLLSARLFY